jgi:molecular chaperone DnaK
MEKLATESQRMGAALYQQPGAEGAAPGGGAGPTDGQSTDDVVDAEIVDEEKDRK